MACGGLPFHPSNPQAHGPWAEWGCLRREVHLSQAGEEVKKASSLYRKWEVSGKYLGLTRRETV